MTDSEQTSESERETERLCGGIKGGGGGTGSRAHE